VQGLGKSSGRSVEFAGRSGVESVEFARSDQAHFLQFFLIKKMPDRPLAYGVVFLRLSGGLGCFSPAIDTYID
jgi:hypothetical protein